MALIQWKQINPELLGGGRLTGSLEISGSMIINGVNIGSYVDTGVVLPSGLISGSTFTDFSSSIYTELQNILHTDVTALNTFTSSINTRVNTLESFSASLDATFATDNQLSILSASIASDLSGIIHTDVTALNTFTGSAQSQINALIAATSSYLTTETDSQTLSINNRTVSISNGNSIELPNTEISYISGLNTSALSQIEVLDYDNNVATVFQNGKLKFIFGEPALPTSISTSTSGFNTNRFNQELDNYTVNASWSNGGYTLISASLYEGSTQLTAVNTGTSISYNENTSGSHTYAFEYTASSPLDNNIYSTRVTTTVNLSKSQPGSPSINATPTVELGASSNQIEQGAVGTVSFTSAYGSANNWEEVSLVTNPVTSPLTFIGGSTSQTISATSTYQSTVGLNNTQLQSVKSTTTTYSKIRSLRYGAATDTMFTQADLETLSNWDTTLGGNIGTIRKGTTTPSGQSVTIVWSGDKYQYIVFDSSKSNLNNITTSGFGVIGNFSLTTVGNYKIYRSNTLQAGGAGSSITYTIT
jgi:hypothetical protein